MSDNSQNNRRIAKNTLLLYLRMFLILAVTLYTSRVVLDTLGVSDYGVYTVVGGFVTMLAYLNSVFIGSTQRFLSFAIGKGDNDNLRATFSTTLALHILLAVFILIVAESFGIWFVNHKLVIEPDRMRAANWVFQFSLASLLLTVLGIPFNSCIISHERMGVYAFVSILEAVMKLVILYFLLILPGDKLIVYAVLHFAISLVVFTCYFIYSRKCFSECTAAPSIDKSLFREMFSFAGWTAFGTLGFSFKDQFSNIIMNGFFGTTINAARGVAMQVSGAVSSFANNFFMAISQQIVKQYAAGDVEQSQKLVYAGTKYSFYMLSLVAVPVVINLDYILKIWLVTVPEYTADFIIISLVTALIYSLTCSVTTALQATGNIRLFQIGVSLILLSELPVTYLLLNRGCPAPVALYPAILTNAIALVFRFFLLRRMIPTYSLRKYYFHTILRCLVILAVSFLLCELLSRLFPEGIGWLCLDVIVCVLVIAVLVFVFGIDKGERRIVLDFIKKKIRNE